jgi:hypothetical protein
LEQISKYLDIAGNKLDYRRYGEVLFDILIAGGLLVPGGSISQDGEKPKTDNCIFAAPEDMESMRNQEQVSWKWKKKKLLKSLAQFNHKLDIISTDDRQMKMPRVNIEVTALTVVCRKNLK